MAARVDVLWTFNPVVYGVLVLGAHVDILAAALALTAVLLASRHPLWAGVALGATVGSKITYALVAWAILWAWRRDRFPVFAARTGRLALGAAAILLPAHLWAGPHVLDQLSRARRSVSLATPWRPVVELLTGPLASTTVRTLVVTVSLAVIALLAIAMARICSLGSEGEAADPSPTDPHADPQADPHTDPHADPRRPDVHVAEPQTASAVTAAFVLITAYSLGAPYALPWYDALTWATLPALAATPLDELLLVRLAVLAMAYVPGRVVTMTPDVEALTLGFRRHVAPYAVLLLWVAILTLAARRHSEPGLGWRRRVR